MVQRRHLIIFLLTVAVVAGCSEETPLPPSASAPAAPGPAAEPAPAVADATPLPPAPPPDVAAMAEPAPSDESALAALTPAVDMSDLFTPPKLEDRVVEVAPPLPPPPEPLPVEPGLPPLRLIGFVDVEEQQALLAIAGTVRLMRVGDAHAGVQVVRIEPPVLALKAEGKNEFELNLLEQPWFYQPSPAAGGSRGSGQVGAVRSSRPAASGTRNPFPRQSPPPPNPVFPSQPPAAAPAPPAMPPPVSPPKAPPIAPLAPKSSSRSSTAGG